MNTTRITRRNLTFAFQLSYVWVIMTLFGAIVFETLVIYPDIFHDVPTSFEVGMAFMSVRGPHDFFPPIGMLSLGTGIGAVATGWRLKASRNWFLGSVLLVLFGEFLLSVFFFWPRNTIMFEQGAAVHSIAVLKQTAREFQVGHWVRVGTSALASLLAFVGLLKAHRQRIVERER